MSGIDRRTFLATGGLALAGIAVACSKKPAVKPGVASLNDIIGQQTDDKSVRAIVVQAVGDVLSRPDSRVTFAITDAAGTQRFTGGSLRVWYAQDADTPAKGPVDVAYHGEGLGTKGIYVVRLDLDKTGPWYVLAVGKPTEAKATLFGLAPFNVVDRVSGPAPGAKAISTPTPTVDDHRGVDPYCTATPPCSMHAISLDVALANGKPTVFNIGTPRFCTSQVCGPVVDVVEHVARDLKDRVNFVHAEVYVDDKDAPAKGELGLAPAPKAWGLQEEPITYWIKSDNTITERIVGPVDVREVRGLTEALLA